MKINITKLGKAIVEAQHGGGLLVLLPDGQVIGAASEIEAASIINKWQQRNTPTDGAAAVEIEWRGCEPPKKGKRK